MHIAVDGGTWTNARGYGRFTREILTAAASLPGAHTFALVVDDSVELPALPGRIATVRVRLGTPPAAAASAAGRRSLRDLAAMSRALARQRADCVFFPSVYTYVPVATRAPVVVCIHDVIPERYPDQVFATRRARLFWTLKARAAVRQAARIVTVSEHARQAVARQFGVDASAIGVLAEAPAAAFNAGADPEPGRRVLARLGLPPDARFLLYVGGLAPHKNLAALIDCVAALRRHAALASVVLLIAGDYSGDVFLSAYPDLRRQAESAGGVFFTGSLGDAEVAGLMRLTQALVLPSFEEGFGLPGIEAAACGAAVIATKHSALPDVLGDAARYVDPHDRHALSTAIEELLTDEVLRTALGRNAAARAQRYTWSAAAARLLAIFDDLDNRT